MINTPEHSNTQFSWPDILWRLLLTILILILLTGFSLTVFGHLTSQPDSRALPTLTQPGTAR